MNEALELADDCDIHAKHADNAIAFEALHNAAAMLRSQHAEIERLKEDWFDHVAGYNLTIDDLRTENAKLRLKALGTFEKWSDKNWSGVLSPNGREEYDAACAALGETK